jgi:bacterioferritin-associated ferredoxin
MFVCVCHAVTDREIAAAVALGAHSMEAVSTALGVGTSCGRCREYADRLIADCRGCAGHANCATAVAGA